MLAKVVSVRTAMHSVKPCCVCGEQVWGGGDDRCVDCGGGNQAYHCGSCGSLYYAKGTHDCAVPNPFIAWALRQARKKTP